MADSDWRQQTYLVRCEWGPVGAARVAGDGAVVVVDVLSFSTSVSVLVERGTAVVPAPWRDGRAASLARDHDADLAVGRREVTDASPWSLSPAALRRAPATPRLVLPSPNGSAIAAASTGVVVAACLRNATAVGRWLRSQGYGADRAVSVIAAGERWPDGSLRPALEDLLGAGAVIAALSAVSLSPEAAAAAALYDAMTPASVADAVRACASGQELAASGFGEDVDIAVEIDQSGVVPVLLDGIFRQAR
ncbi:MAG: 2-phosphosulfolactate phosphatase [Mycobacteriales bacterium]|nr:2-phosphosulfolactate phosphatase [Mycobacteriales bacterium]